MKQPCIFADCGNNAKYVITVPGYSEKADGTPYGVRRGNGDTDVPACGKHLPFYVQDLLRSRNSVEVSAWPGRGRVR